jgi:flagellin-specific chaperone FliS
MKRALAVYKQAQTIRPTRIDLILGLYRNALEFLGEARAALAENRSGAVKPLLLKTQMIVMGLASGLPAERDEVALNFLRLYEFVSYQLVQGTPESIDAATGVLRTLMERFMAVREQAIALELQGKIPPLDRDPLLSVTA